MNYLLPLDRNTECVINRPTTLESAPCSPVVNTKYCTGIFKTVFNAVNGDVYISRHIPTLLKIGSPLTVTRGVIPIIVDALDGMLGRGSYTHVIAECDEVEPSGGDFDTSSSVPVVSWIILVIASGLHVRPAMISRIIYSECFGGLFSHNILRQMLFRMKSVEETATEGGVRSLNLSNTGELYHA